MAVFAEHEIDWQRLDYFTIATDGVAAVDVERADACRAWLAARGYRIEELDCAAGFESVCAQVTRLFGWVEQFGYEYQGHSLDALNDGFDFDVPDEGGVVLALVRPDLLWERHPEWTLGLLAIGADYTRRRIAEGRRFFTVCFVPRESKLVGEAFERLYVPVPWPHFGARDFD